MLGIVVWQEDEVIEVIAVFVMRCLLVMLFPAIQRAGQDPSTGNEAIEQAQRAWARRCWRRR
jgi:hypothetical protein